MINVKELNGFELYILREAIRQTAMVTVDDAYRIAWVNMHDAIEDEWNERSLYSLYSLNVH